MPQIKASWRLWLNQNQLIHIIKNLFDLKNIAANHPFILIVNITKYGKKIIFIVAKQNILIKSVVFCVMNILLPSLLSLNGQKSITHSALLDAFN